MKIKEQEIDDIRKTYYVDIAWLIDHGFKECTEEQYVSPISWRKGYELDEDGQEESGITLYVDTHGSWVAFIGQDFVLWDGLEPGVGMTPCEAINDLFMNCTLWLSGIRRELFKYVVDVVYTGNIEQ
jgi:hypothetical protein